MFKKFVVFKSTVAILSILPFFAAATTDALPPNGIKPNNKVAFEEPVLSASLIEKLDPLTGSVIEQPDKKAKTNELKITFFIINNFIKAYSFKIGFSAYSLVCNLMQSYI
jgi:hypothetical protein